MNQSRVQPNDFGSNPPTCQQKSTAFSCAGSVTNTYFCQWMCRPVWAFVRALFLIRNQTGTQPTTANSNQHPTVLSPQHFVSSSLLDTTTHTPTLISYLQHPMPPPATTPLLSTTPSCHRSNTKFKRNQHHHNNNLHRSPHVTCPHLSNPQS